MSSTVTPLADGFSAATRAEWLALVAKTLKGAGPESLERRTADGLPIAPLYIAEDRGTPLRLTPGPRNTERGWDVRAFVANSNLVQANTEALAALASGADSLLLKLDAGDSAGLPIGNANDLARVLDGVLTDLAPIALDAGLLGPHAARWLGSVAKASPGAQLALHLDPLSAFAASGTSPGSIEAHIDAAASVAARLCETYPKASLFLASGAVVHEAGGSPAWEIAVTAASAVAYAKALVGAGLMMSEAFARIALGVSVDAEPLGAIAKLRATRVVWARIAEACAVDLPARVEARSSRRMLTRADRWTNLIRLTSAGFAAAVGGADAILLGAFTDALGPPEAFASRMSRNAQLILMEEAHLGRVVDPAGGSWAMEAQTADLARAAWDAFVAIEAAGGLVEALRSGVVAAAVGKSREALRTALADGALRMIGVTDFKSAETTPDPQPADLAPHVTPPDPRQAGDDSRCTPLSAVRIEELV